jgi:dihydroorotase-like cyclic amidohydrolase
MWEKIRDGKVDLVGSDHVPYPLPFKERDIWETAAGAPGVQTMFPLMITEGVNKGRITLPQMVRVMSEGPAKVCGIYPRKGSASIGSDADFAIFDLKSEREVKLQDQVGLEWTLYEGMKVVYPDTVLVRGKAVVDQGQVVGEQGYGEFVTPD